MADSFNFLEEGISADGLSGDGAVVFITDSIEAGTRSAESLEAAGLEVVVAAATTDTSTSTDDVVIDGRIITAENFDASQDGSDLLIVNNGDGSDFLEADGEGNDLLIGGDGVDVLRAASEEGTLVFTTADEDGGDADSADPVLLVISNQDFWYQDYADTRDDGTNPTEQFSFNYEEITFEQEPVFDSFYDVV